MKLLRVSLLMLLAFLMGITFYRAWFLTPAPIRTAPAVELPQEQSRPESVQTVMLAKNADIDRPFDPSLDLAGAIDPDSVDLFLPNVSSFDLEVAEVPAEAAAAEDPFDQTPDVPSAESAEQFNDFASPDQEPTPSEDEFSPPVSQEQPIEDLGGDEFPEVGRVLIESGETVIEAHEGGRLRIQSGETVIEADEAIVGGVRVGPIDEAGWKDVEPSPIDGQATGGNPQSGTPLDASNPIPEFLRGQPLPPLVAGQKVVTVQVPVENWVDLGWGDIVRVDFEQGPIHAIGSEGSVLTAENFSLQVVAEAEIYALPQFAPEHGDRVPVCLKLGTKDAKELLILRKNPGKYTLTVVRQHASQGATHESAPTPVAAHDDFATPTPRRASVPYQSPDSESTTPLTPTSGFEERLPEDPNVPANELGNTATYDSGDGPATFQGNATPQQETAQSDVVLETQVPAVEAPLVEQSNYPTNVQEEFRPPNTGEAPLTYTAPYVDPNAGVQTKRAPLTTSDTEDEALPTIEPSEAGTIRGIDMHSELSLAAGSTLVIEDFNGGAISRAAGFDPTVIRVTALSRMQLKLEALKAGTTVLTVTIPNIYPKPLRVPVEVTGARLGPTTLVAPRAARATPSWIDEPADAELPQQETEEDRQRKEVIETLTSLYPDADLQISWIRNSLLLRGTVNDNQKINGIVEIAGQYAPTVLNQLRVAGMAETAPPYQSARPYSGSPQGASRSSGVEVPPDMAVVVLANIGARQVRGRSPGTLVDVYRIGAGSGFEKAFENVELLGTHAAGNVASLLVTPEQQAALTEPSDKPIAWVLVPHGVQPVHDSGAIDANGAPVLDPRTGKPTTEAAPVSDVPVRRPRDIAPGKSVVSVGDLSEDVLSWLLPGQLVDLGRVRTIKRVVEREGHVSEEVQTFVQVVINGATVFHLKPDDSTAGFEVSVEQVQPLQSIPSHELVVTPHQESSRAVSELSYKSDDTPYQDSSEAGRPAAADDQAEPSLRDEIRALHDDVRRLITLLEQRMSDSDARDSANPNFPSAADTTLGRPVPQSAPSELEPSDEAEEPRSESAPAQEQPAGDAEEPVVEPSEAAIEFKERLWDEIGLRVSPLRNGAPALAGQPYHGGLLIDEVRPSSAMADAGLRAGDILVGLHLWETVSAESLRYVLDHHPRNHEAIKFYLVREGETLHGNVTLHGRPATEKPGAAAELVDVDASLQAALSVGLNR